jgi:hypothetical protein
MDETLASGGLNGRAQLLGRLQGRGGMFCRLAQFHASKVLRFFAGRGSVIHTSAWVMVTNQMSGLEQGITWLRF